MKRAFRNNEEQHSLPYWVAAAVMAYAAVVLLVDLLATYRVQFGLNWVYFDWKLFAFGEWLTRFLQTHGIPSWPAQWMTWQGVGAFDLYKFVFWFVVPLLFSLPKLEPGWLLPKRLTRTERNFFALLVLMVSASVFIVLFVPGLRAYYPSVAYLPRSEKIVIFFSMLSWVLSWLPGWEFLHRYCVLRAATVIHPRLWLLVPLYEVGYHLSKHPLEAAGMGILSLVLTYWTYQRATMFYPALVHFSIEMSLALFLLFV